MNAIWALQPESSQEILSRIYHEQAGPDPKALVPDLPDKPESPFYELENDVAVIRISGVIDRTAKISFFTGLPYTEGQDRIRQALTAALADPAASAILLSVNSPGGTAAGTKELADFIAASSQQKPIAAYADGLCASAAYWLAAATGNLLAPVTAQVGSIGVIAVLTDWTKAAEKAGLARTVLTSGRWKAAGSPDKALSDEERALFQDQLEKLHAIFKADILNHMQIANPDGDWAEGQTFLAEQALQLGLVSGIARDEADAVRLLADSLKTEANMDLKQLKAEHPKLVNELATELEAAAKADTAAQVAAARAGILTFVKAIAGEEVAAKVRALAESGITAQQFEALAPMLSALPPHAANVPEPADTASAKILAAITSATGRPVAAGKMLATGKNRLLADAERRQGKVS